MIELLIRSRGRSLRRLDGGGAEEQPLRGNVDQRTGSSDAFPLQEQHLHVSRQPIFNDIDYEGETFSFLIEL